MVKIRTVIPPNAKPGTSVIQVVNPKTNKPTRIRVPANAQPGQVIELELPEDPNRSITSSSSKLGSIPPTRSLKADPQGVTSEAAQNSASSFSKDLGHKSTANIPNTSPSLRVPGQLSIGKGSHEPGLDREPLVNRNQSDKADANDMDGPGCCYSCMTFRFCRSMCG
jgi:hypothetical protein